MGTLAELLGVAHDADPRDRGRVAKVSRAAEKVVRASLADLPRNDFTEEIGAIFALGLAALALEEARKARDDRREDMDSDGGGWLAEPS